MSHGGAVWRAAVADDLGAIDSIARLVHPTLPERPEVFAEKLRLFPDGCFVLSEGAAVRGYALSHPWAFQAVPALDRFLGALPERLGCLFLHDVALLPAVRGKGGGAALVPRLEDVARQHGLDTLALVAVHGTAPFWGKLGFRRVDTPALAMVIVGYGAGAAYMMRALPRR